MPKRHSNKKRPRRKTGSVRRIPIHQEMIPQIGCNAAVMRGGDASDHAIAVYGGIGQQHAIVNSNLIATNHVGSEVITVAPVQNGGKKGGSVIADLAVPAVLLYANQTVGKKRFVSSKRRSSRNRKSRKFGRR